MRLRIIGVMALALLSVVGTVTPASAAPSADFRNDQTRRCIDDSFNFNIRSLPCNGSHYQQWRADGPNWPLRSVATGRCIDDSFQHGLRTFLCNGSNYQAWDAIRSGSVVRFKNKATGRCIDDSFEVGLRAFACNGLPYQAWRAGI